ncbi:ribosomal protein L7/L12 [Micromonospora sp. WMMA1949]|uniref:ribosomal protein L7/L12 n=1 Tax=Micromonospora sp. WMMA1949 TaxID=3015162 RepID=UPI0022B5EDE6|nr:ribosomal protein L7/L12 [Micromonospora sp. WMMA1949]MCZ7424289.1 ribosomal protein L7/L12 [Micromonospora sp. WMMA1949]
MTLRKPDLPAGAHRDLSLALHELHRKAGWPSVRDLERAINVDLVRRTRIYDAFTSPRLPAWGVLSVLVPELASRVPRMDADEQVDRFHRLWDTAAQAEDARTRAWSVVLTDSGSRRIPLVELIRSVTGAGLAEVTEMLVHCPATLAAGLTQEGAERLVSRIEALGALAEAREEER